MISIARATNRHVTRWRDGQMVLRWTAGRLLNAERSFRRIKGYKQMPQLVEALKRHAHPTRSPTLNMSVPPPKVHHGSSPKFHATRDMLRDLILIGGVCAACWASSDCPARAAAWSGAPGSRADRRPVAQRSLEAGGTGP
jgi:hypothetical protein